MKVRVTNRNRARGYRVVEGRGLDGNFRVRVTEQCKGEGYGRVTGTREGITAI